jgi:hypothetical protein
MTAPLRTWGRAARCSSLVHNFGTFGGVLDHSDKDDVASAEIVLHLMSDYIRG